MQINLKKKIAIAGAGTMGLGIAQVFAQAGFSTLLYDVNDQALNQAQNTIDKQWAALLAKGKMSADAQKSAQQNLRYSTNLNDMVADVVIEAIIEKLEAKITFFKQVASINTPETILCSNTSSLSITQLAKDIAQPTRVAGLHFFNPASVMKLVEIVAAAQTSDSTVEALKNLATQIGKISVVCKDSPGFIVNRVARHYYVESLRIAEELAADIATTDTLLESAGFKMGPFKLMDVIGNDINLAVTSSLHQAFHGDAKFRPSRLQQQKVEAGYLGKKTGKGFYDYS